MSDQPKRLLHMFTPKGQSAAYYENLEVENASLKRQVETLQRQVDILLRRQMTLDPDFELPTRH